ncbi:hypothetical protein Tco_0651193 [Tanacetum coccineum]
MANLEFCDKHNMVAYLKKPTGSEGFQEIVDFLNDSYIRYALTKNPTIYVSLIEKFWQTATVRTVDNGEQEITATVDGKEFTITEASVRRHLQLADVDGISVLLTTKIFDQLSLMGYVLTDDKLTFQKGLVSLLPKVPLSVIYKEWYDKVERDTTTAARKKNVDAEQASWCQEAMGSSIAQTRSKRKVYGAAYTKLIKKVKKLEKTVKSNQARRRAKIVVSDDEEDLEDSSKQGRMIEEIDQDAGVTLVTPTQGEDQPEDQLGVLSAAKVLADAAKTNVHTYTRRRRAVSTGSGGISTASRLFSTAEESVSTAGASMPVSTAGMVQEVNISIPSPVVVKDKGKGKMEESEDEQTKRTKLQQEQERLGHEAAVRLQEELDEEERQRMARVHEAAQSFTEEEWENIRARVEADEELSRRLQAEERNKYSEVDQAKMLVDLINQRKKYFAAQKAEAKRNKPMTQAQQRNYMINYIKHMGSHTLQQLKIYSFDELKELFETTMKNVNTFVPMETEDRGRASKLAAGSSQATIIDSAEVGSSKRDAEAELDHEGSKRQKTNEASGSVQEQPEEEEKELSQEDLQQMMMVVPVEEVYVEALQVKYPIIDWEDMLKIFNRDDLVMLWNLVKERFSSTEPTDDKERALWVELKRLFEPNTDDTLWKLQRYMHDPLKWRLYDTCGVYHVSIERGTDIFMLVEKEYPLSKGVLTLMLVNRLLVEQHSKMANEFLRKILIQANKLRQ